MTAVRLTKAATGGKPPMPLTVNPAHVVKLEPRFQPRPNLGSQQGGVLPGYSGCQVTLVTGERELVLEDYPIAHEKLWPSEVPAPPAQLQTQQTGDGHTPHEHEVKVVESTPAKKVAGKTGEPVSDKLLAENLKDEPAGKDEAAS